MITLLRKSTCRTSPLEGCAVTPVKKKIYISGQISKLPEEVSRAHFRAAGTCLKKQGYTVINPRKNGLPFDAPWTVHMRRDIKLLMTCDKIYMLSGWENSRGAIIELMLSRWLDIEVLFESKNK